MNVLYPIALKPGIFIVKLVNNNTSDSFCGGAGNPVVQPI